MKATLYKDKKIIGYYQITITCCMFSPFIWIIGYTINLTSNTYYYARERIPCHYTPKILNNYSYKTISWDTFSDIMCLWVEHVKHQDFSCLISIFGADPAKREEGFGA